MSQTQQPKKPKSEAKAKVPAPTLAFNVVVRQVDEYKAPKDLIWNDVIKHERVLDKAWKETWEKTIIPKGVRPLNYNISPQKPTQQSNVRRDVASFYKASPTQPIPLLSSAIVGWRSSDPANSMEYFGVRYMSNKIKFLPQQYGFYRHHKYIKSEAENPHKEQVKFPPEKGIKHVVKTLLC